MAGLSANIRTGVTLGGGSSPLVTGAGVAGQSPATAAYGAGATSGSDNSYLGATPGHLTWYLGIAAFALLVAIRHSLPR